MTTTGALSDCAPVYYNGQVVWYVTDNSAPVFYTLDESGVTRHGGSPVEPEQTQEPGQTQEPEQPKETQQSQQPALDFSDVPASFWGSAYIRKAAQAGLMTGTGDESFDPNGSLTQAQTMVLAYQLHSQSNGGTLPQTSGAWYMPYYQYCVDNGLLTGRFDPDDLNQTASRFDMVAILDKAIPAGRMAAETSVPDGAIPDLDEDDAYGDLVYRWYRAGIVSGDSEGRFNGDSGITRAETAVILCQINGLA